MSGFKYQIGRCKSCGQGPLVVAKEKASGQFWVVCSTCGAAYASPEEALAGQGRHPGNRERRGLLDDPAPGEVCNLGWEKYLLDKDTKAECIRCLLPQEKCDTSHNAQLALLTDEEIAPILPELLEWFMDENWGVARSLVPILLPHEEILIPHIIEILSQDDLIWLAWIMELLIPKFTSKGKQTLRPYVQRIAQRKETDEDTLYAIDVAQECLAAMGDG